MKFPLVCLAAHNWKLRRWVDFRKCQTSTATPAEPGGLPGYASVGLPESACRGYRHPLGVRIIVVLRIDLRLVTNVCAFGDRACDAGGVGIENCVTARIDKNDTGSRKIQS